MTKKRLDTIAVHAGQEAPDPATGARAVPIYQTASYVFKSPEHAANLFALKELGNIYTRLMNPTTDVFEKRVAAIEGGTGALAIASGQAAISLALLTITQVGDEIVSANNLYGGTYELFHYTFPKLGRTVKFVDSSKPEEFKKAITSKTRAIYAETIGNPKLDVPDFEAIAKIAHEAGIPLGSRQHGRRRHSRTHRLRRRHNRRYPQPNTSADTAQASAASSLTAANSNGTTANSPNSPNQTPAYHGVKYWDAFGNFPGLGNVAFIFKARVQLLRDIGPTLSPFNALLFLQGLETLPLRQRKHSENALKVAQFLQKSSTG